ncbi:rhodopsin, GQ-coupled-like [Saccoglossus kowalevskii]|uniref:Melanopsin-like n=1 Tax=Saccoglossus kowalevskii TaxID=10224 RepID=A0ABM0MX06_SACKO|nr:PREDICTED: melanopsin-like [Saccoglossus kowalevskii]
MAANSTETFLDVSATNSTQEILDTIVTTSTSDTAFDSIATSSTGTFIDIITANLTDAFVNNTVQNSTNITEEVLDIIGVKSYEQVLDIISACMLLIVAFVGTAGNIQVFYIVYANKKLRTPPNIQLVSLAAADMLVCIITSLMRFFVMVKSLLHGEININGPFCIGQIFVIYTSTMTTIVSLGTIAAIRAITVADKLSPSTKRTVIYSLISVNWITGLGYGTWKAWAGEDLACNPEPISQEVRNASRGGILMVFLTLCTIVVSYSYIYHVTNRHEKSFQRAMKAADNSGQRQRKTTNLATLKVAVLLISMFIISYFPVPLYGLLISNNDSYRNEHVASFFFSFMCLGSLINPIIYSLTSNQFKNHLFFKKNNKIQPIEQERNPV